MEFEAARVDGGEAAGASAANAIARAMMSTNGRCQGIGREAVTVAKPPS